MIMLKNYLHLDFGQSFFRDAKITDLIIQEIAGVRSRSDSGAR